MALFINTNVDALKAQHNLAKSQQMQSQSLERLSSGKRINSAKDDAAGLAISSRFTTQVNGMRQARRNANDGVSLAQVTGGALSQVTENMQRIRTLAVQSANSTNSKSDRIALNQEVQQRMDEITRVATQTTFNGLKVLDGSFGRATFQVGANVGDTISVNLTQGVRARQMGELNQAAVTGDAIDDMPATLTSDISFQVGDGDAVSLAKGQTYNSVGDIADAINTLGVDGLLATVGEDGDGKQVVELRAVGGDLTIDGDADVIGLSAGTTEAQADNKSLANADVLTVADANKTIQRVDKALDRVNGLRGQLGAIQNRFQSTIANLGNVAQNMTAARSRIQDADFAAMTAQLTKARILQSAGISVLAQANTTPQSALKLLQ